MEKSYEKKLQNRSFVTGIFLLVLLLVSFTYANQSTSFFKKVNGEKLGIDEEAYGSTSFDSNNIELVPILDKDVIKRKTNVIHISFFVGGAKDNTVDNIIYDVALNDLDVDCSLISPYIKWKLIKNGIEISNGSLDYKFDTIKDGRLVLTNIQQDLVKYNVNKKNYDFYNFYLWISDNCQDENFEECFNKSSQNELMGKNLSGKIEIELYADVKKELVRSPNGKKDTHTCFFKEE